MGRSLRSNTKLPPRAPETPAADIQRQRRKERKRMATPVVSPPSEALQRNEGQLVSPPSEAPQRNANRVEDGPPLVSPSPKAPHLSTEALASASLSSSAVHRDSGQSGYLAHLGALSAKASAANRKSQSFPTFAAKSALDILAAGPTESRRTMNVLSMRPFKIETARSTSQDSTLAPPSQGGLGGDSTPRAHLRTKVADIRGPFSDQHLMAEDLDEIEQDPDANSPEEVRGPVEEIEEDRDASSAVPPRATSVEPDMDTRDSDHEKSSVDNSDHDGTFWTQREKRRAAALLRARDNGKMTAMGITPQRGDVEKDESDESDESNKSNESNKTSSRCAVATSTRRAAATSTRQAPAPTKAPASTGNNREVSLTSQGGRPTTAYCQRIAAIQREMLDVSVEHQVTMGRVLADLDNEQHGRSAKESIWNKFQTWYSHEHRGEKPREMHVSQWNKLVSQAFQDRLAELDDTLHEDARVLERHFAEVVEWHAQHRQDQLDEDRKSGRLATMVRNAAKSLSRLGTKIYHESGVHVFGVIVDEEGQQSCTCAGSPQFAEMVQAYPVHGVRSSEEDDLGLDCPVSEAPGLAELVQVILPGLELRAHPEQYAVDPNDDQETVALKEDKEALASKAPHFVKWSQEEVDAADDVRHEGDIVLATRVDDGVELAWVRDCASYKKEIAQVDSKVARKRPASARSPPPRSATLGVSREMSTATELAPTPMEFSDEEGPASPPAKRSRLNPTLSAALDDVGDERVSLATKTRAQINAEKLRAQLDRQPRPGEHILRYHFGKSATPSQLLNMQDEAVRVRGDPPAYWREDLGFAKDCWERRVLPLRPQGLPVPSEDIGYFDRSFDDAVLEERANAEQLAVFHLRGIGPEGVSAAVKALGGDDVGLSLMLSPHGNMGTAQRYHTREEMYLTNA
ncbi:unnamed protein product [Mycena citricolor]|uniref:Uncharacterized protein n=1 Tax=Mycena citricolor TaxID=2018698 RepID=A0AAD2HHQ9_9AGAR|nr:unnamed protein product [Mycena citricolor]